MFCLKWDGVLFAEFIDFSVIGERPNGSLKSFSFLVSILCNFTNRPWSILLTFSLIDVFKWIEKGSPDWFVWNIKKRKTHPLLKGNCLKISIIYHLSWAGNHFHQLNKIYFVAFSKFPSFFLHGFHLYKLGIAVYTSILLSLYAYLDADASLMGMPFASSRTIGIPADWYVFMEGFNNESYVWRILIK